MDDQTVYVQKEIDAASFTSLCTENKVFLNKNDRLRAN